MTRLIAAAACLSLTLSVTRLLPVPYDLATLAVAAYLLYRLVGDCAGRGAACVAAVLLVSSLLPALSSARVDNDTMPPALALLSFPWWIPLLVGAVVIGGLRSVGRTAAMALLAWWGAATAAALLAPASVAAMASFVETAPAAALAGIAVARLADASWNETRRRHLAFALGATCLWQAWLVVGTGRPARVLVPMLAAALMIAITDLLTTDDGRERDAIGAALVIAMLVLGLVPGAHGRVMQQQALARAVVPPLTGVDAPSSIDAP